MKCRYNDKDYLIQHKKAHKNKWKNKKHPRGMLNKTHSIETRNKMKGRIPWNFGKNKYNDIRIKRYGKKISKIKKQFYKDNPKKHPNYNQKLISKPQLKLYKYICKKFNDVKLNYPFKTNKTIRYLDVAVPSLKIDFEYDGPYWHQDEGKNLTREYEIRNKGWAIIRFTGDKQGNLTEQIIDTAIKVLKIKNGPKS